MSFPLPPNATIGIIGGGQLGRMSALAAARLGYRSHILTPEQDSPAAQVSAAVTIAEYEDQQALRAFAAAVDVITFEFENISADGLSLLEHLKPVRPSPAILRISQYRIAEKTFLNQTGIATAPWRAVSTPADLEAAIVTIGLPAVLKTTRFGYDGKGQALLRTLQDASRAFVELGAAPLILEGFVDFAQEISVIVARGADGAMAAFDTVENRHRDHILDLTLAPAPIPDSVAAEAQHIARRIAEGLGLVGLLAVEMFVDARGKVLVKLNVASENLAAVLALVPALKAPTVSELAGDGGFAVETVVAKNQINVLIPALKDAGATGILELPISKIIA